MHSSLVVLASSFFGVYGRRLQTDGKQDQAVPHEHRCQYQPLAEQIAASGPLMAFSYLLLTLHPTTGWQVACSVQGQLAANADISKHAGSRAVRLIVQNAKLSADVDDESPSSRALSELLLAHTADREQSPMTEFLSWMRKVGAVTDRLYLEKSTVGGGQGVFLAEDVKKESILLRVPIRACFRMQNAYDDPDVGELLQRFAADNGEAGEVVAFCAYLVKKLLTEGPAGEEFGPYLSVLPFTKSGGQEHILWWSNAEVQALEGSPAFKDTRDIRRALDRTCQTLGPILSKVVMSKVTSWQSQPMSQEQVEQLVCEAMRGAFVSHFSRTLKIPKDPYAKAGLEVDSSMFEGALIPMLDFVQHNIVKEPMVGYCRFGDEVIVVAQKEMSKGTELFLSYGGPPEMPPYMFLPRFGFVDGSSKPPLELVKNKDPLLFG